MLLKLSGEALAGSKKMGFDEETVRKVALQVKELTEDAQIGIVIGGGNFWRGRSSENIDRTLNLQLCLPVKPSYFFYKLSMQTIAFSYLS